MLGTRFLGSDLTSLYIRSYQFGKATSFDKDRDSGWIGGGCSEYSNSYETGFKAGCESVASTYDSCQILINGYEGYCPDHPESPSCVEFLHNATNKRPASTTGACAGMGDPRPNIICPQESNPEKYCLNTNNTLFCKTIGDICDPGGFVRPEYPYCTK